MADTDKPPPRTKISLTSSRTKPLPKPSTAAPNGIKRPRALFADDEEEDGQAEKVKPKDTNITTFGAGKSDKEQRAATPPRVIAPLANKDWRGDGNRKRQKSILPGKERAAAPAKEDEDDKIASGQVKAGLQLRTPRRASRSPSADPAPAPATHAANENTPQPPTDESRALAALTGDACAPSTTIAPVASETEAFARDYAAAPPSPTLAQFDATPVDGFGAALLRGYLKPGQTLETWKEKQEAAMRKSKTGKSGAGVEAKREGRRPDLLGMGAREMEVGGEKKKGGQDLRRQRREQETYAPLMRRNRETGEVVTQAELEGLVKGGDKGSVNGDAVERREGRLLENGERNGDDEERRRERKGDDEEYDWRDRDRRRERERDHDGDRDRERHRRRRDEYSDDDRDRRRRDRHDERDRHERRHRDRSRDRHGSRR